MSFIIKLCILIFIQFITCFDYKPPSRSIEVIDGGDYSFGIVETDSSINVTFCYYDSNTGINGSFVVVKYWDYGYKKNYKVNTNNEISNYGQAGFCQLTIKNVDDKSPTVWKLKPINETGTEFDEVEFNVKFFYKLPLKSDVVSVGERGSFYQYAIIDKTLTSCKLTIGTNEIDIDVNNEKVTKLDGMSFESFGQGLCGFKCQNASKTEVDTWVLTAVDNQQLSYRTLFNYKYFIDPPISERHKKIFTTLGTSTSILCGEENQQTVCNLFDPTNKSIATTKTNCYHYIKTTTLQHLGLWKCYVGRFPHMQLWEYTVELIYSKIDQPVRTWFEENDRFVSIGCEWYEKESVKACRMVSPNYTVLNLVPGIIHNHYWSLGTNLSQALCVLQIEKPLLESERGLWKCELSTGSKRVGGFISVENEAVPDFEKYQKIVTQLTDTILISCQIPYSSDYCFIKSPSGQEYKDNQESTIGMCSVEISNVTAEHVGVWKCYFARKSGLPDEELSVEVEVAEILLSTANVKASSGETANLLCSSHGFPMRYCRFTAPNSKSYFIKNETSESRISYYGKGLEYGDCGITINEITSEDSGNWTCFAKLGDNDKKPDITAIIELYIHPRLTENPALAIGLGTAAAVIVVSAIVGYIGVKKWKKRRAYTTDVTTSDDNAAETTSQGDIFSFGPSIDYSSFRNESEDHPHQT